MTTLPTNFTNSTPVRDIHADAHNDTNAAINALEAAVVALGGGSAAFGHVHNQAVAASVWNITYDLPFKPNVTITDSGGSKVHGDVLYIGTTQIQITFTPATLSGQAVLS